jgi:serine/threonine-protein kinase RsbW
MAKGERGTKRHPVLRRQAQSQFERGRTLIRPDQATSAGKGDPAEPAIDERRADERDRRLSALLLFCSTCHFAMTIPADPATIPVITDGVSQMLEEKQWPEKDIAAVQIALQEAMANAIRHGCHNDINQILHCSVTVDEPDEVRIVVRDSGAGFDPESVADPLAPANVLKPSGRGIFLIKNLMDHVHFADSGREVEMRKKKTPSLRANAFTSVAERESR